MAVQLAWLPAAIAATAATVQQIIKSRQERKAYKEMQAYNSPKAQQERFAQAGLSPWLMYSQGNAGNMTSPSPVQDYGLDKAGKGIGHYTNLVNSENTKQEMKLRNKMFPIDYNMKRLEGLAAAEQLNIMTERSLQERYKSQRMGLDLMTDYGREFERMSDGTIQGGFRNKMNELKKQMSEASLLQMQQTIQKLKNENEVGAVKAHYARDYGMVGGDWTQGLGILRSLGSGAGRLFRGSKTISDSEKSMLSTYRKFKGQQQKRDENRFLFEQLTH